MLPGNVARRIAPTIFPEERAPLRKWIALALLGFACSPSTAAE